MGQIGLGLQEAETLLGANEAKVLPKVGSSPSVGIAEKEQGLKQL